MSLHIGGGRTIPPEKVIAILRDDKGSVIYTDDGVLHSEISPSTLKHRSSLKWIIESISES